MLRMNAWVLDFGLSYKVAVGGRELLHLIDVPVTFVVPYTPAFCHKVVSWQGRLLPVMELACRFGGEVKEAQFIAVIGYQNKRGEQPQFGAIALTAPPKQISVSDDQACGLPDSRQGLSAWTISCFEHQGDTVPVLNLNKLFNSAPEIS